MVAVRSSPNTMLSPASGFGWALAASASVMALEFRGEGAPDTDSTASHAWAKGRGAKTG